MKLKNIIRAVANSIHRIFPNIFPHPDQKMIKQLLVQTKAMRYRITAIQRQPSDRAALENNVREHFILIHMIATELKQIVWCSDDLREALANNLARYLLEQAKLQTVSVHCKLAASLSAIHRYARPAADDSVRSIQLDAPSMLLLLIDDAKTGLVSKLVFDHTRDMLGAWWVDALRQIDFIITASAEDK